jgi:putative membrane protein
MRRAFLFSGVTMLALVWFGPLLTAWRVSFAAHMLAHMVVVAIASPVIALGTGGISLGRLADSQQLSSRIGGERGGQTSFLPSMAGHLNSSGKTLPLSLPIVASLVELIIVWGWHAPAARSWAMASTLGTVVEQASFLAAGLFLWLSCLAAYGTGARARRFAGAVALLLTTVHMTLLGALLALAPRPLFGLEDVTCFGLTLAAGEDQQLGATIMLFVGATVYLAGGVALISGVLRTPAGSSS